MTKLIIQTNYALVLTMNNFTFYNPVKIIFGKGQIAQLSKQIPANARILLTYGGGVYSKTESTIR